MTTTAQKVINEVLNPTNYTYAGTERFIDYNYRETQLARALAVALEAFEKSKDCPLHEGCKEALSQINQIFGDDDEKA